MNFIEHLVEPERLLLVWQAPDGKVRARLEVGELLREGEEITFRYLTESEDFARACELGFTCYPAFRKTDRDYTTSVMDTFMRRLPPRKRGDFSRYLEQWRLTAETTPSDFALLAYSGAKLPNDGFSVDWPLAEVEAPCELLLEVAGFRYQEDVEISDLAEGMSVQFQLESENPYDPRALSVEVDGRRIGYVKRSQRDAVLSWLDRYEVEAVIERLNGTPDRPLVYLFCRIRHSDSGLSSLRAAG